MALDALLSRLEGRAVTPVTAGAAADVTPKPAPMLACTPVTPVTSENDDAQRHGLTLADLKEAAGTDWNEIAGDRALFETFAAAVATRRMRARGEVPSLYTASTTCAGCGQVPIFEGAPARVDGCPWCFNRHAGRPVPKLHER